MYVLRVNQFKLVTIAPFKRSAIVRSHSVTGRSSLWRWSVSLCKLIAEQPNMAKPRDLILLLLLLVHGPVVSTITQQSPKAPAVLGAMPACSPSPDSCPIVGAHYFSGWYSCDGLSPCFSHWAGYTPTGTKVDDWRPSYPEVNTRQSQ